MPLAFAYDFQTISMLQLEKRPKVISDILKSVSEKQIILKSSEYYFVCEIVTEVKAAKKITEGADIVVSIDPNTPSAVFIKTQRLIDSYPLSHRQVLEGVEKQIPGLQQSQVNKVIRSEKMKYNEKYSAFNFPTNSKKENYLKTGKMSKTTPSIYNENAVRFIVEKINEKGDRANR